MVLAPTQREVTCCNSSLTDLFILFLPFIPTTFLVRPMIFFKRIMINYYYYYILRCQYMFNCARYEYFRTTVNGVSVGWVWMNADLLPFKADYSSELFFPIPMTIGLCEKVLFSRLGLFYQTSPRFWTGNHTTLPLCYSSRPKTVYQSSRESLPPNLTWEFIGGPSHNHCLI